MLKNLTKLPKTFLLIPAGLILLSSIAAGWFLARPPEPHPKTNPVEPVKLAPKADDPNLKVLAHSANPSVEKNRARYLLAINLIKQYQGGQAIQELDNLEKDYPLLTPYIWLKRGRAYQLTNDSKNALDTWQKVAQTYKGTPIEPEALYRLGTFDPKYWEQAIAKYPYHPLTWEIINQQLQKNPNQVKLLKILVKYNPRASAQARNILVEKHAAELTAKDWENIAKGYWEQPDYKKAALAYSKAPKTATNRYRLARSMQLSQRKDLAKLLYQQMVKDFPKSEETRLALQRLAKLSSNSEAINYLNIIIQKHPEAAAEALKSKAELLEKMGDRKAATEAYQMLLKKYPQANETADYRWQIAYLLAIKGDIKKAYSWAHPILVNSPDAPVAPKASFWIGRWFKQLGKNKQAEQAFKQTINKYPQSYYAWRSAVNLGANVGDFNNVGQKQVSIETPSQDPQPTAGSDLFKELAQLGQWSDADRLWAGEMQGKDSRSVNETFTDSLLLAKRGRFLEASNAIVTLRKRQDPKDQKDWQVLRQQSTYWYTLFPFFYEPIILKWSTKRNLNPLLVIGLMRQESGFQADIKSPVGALGLMQIMPATAKWINAKVNLPQFSLTKPEDNINLGTWYLNYTHQQYKNDSMLAVASYNAGPGNVSRWLKQYGLQDHDTFVENIPFPETKNYVESVFGNYWNYLRLYNPEVVQWVKSKG